MERTFPGFARPYTTDGQHRDREPQQEIKRLSGPMQLNAHDFGGWSQLRTMDNSAARILRFGVFEVDLKAREVRKGGMRVKLQQKPFQILEMLLERPGELVTRKEVAERLWPGVHVTFDRSMNTAVNGLRRA